MSGHSVVPRPFVHVGDGGGEGLGTRLVWAELGNIPNVGNWALSIAVNSTSQLMNAVILGWLTCKSVLLCTHS